MAAKRATAVRSVVVIVPELYPIQLMSDMESDGDKIPKVDPVGATKMSPNEWSKFTEEM